MRDTLEILDNDNLVIVSHATTDALRAAADYAAAVRDSGYDATKGDMGYVGSVPVFVIRQWCNDNGIDYRDFCRSDKYNERLLNSPEVQAFRTWKGRL